MEDFLSPLLHDHQVVYQFDLIILESATHGFPDLREMLYFRMSLHEFTQLFLMSRRDEGAKTYLALHHVWREMTDDGTLGAHPTNPVEGCADANPKTMLPNDT